MFAYSSQDSEIALEKNDAVSSKSLLYSFHLKSGEHDVAEWIAVLQNEKLYVEVPQGDIPPGAKEWYSINNSLCACCTGLDDSACHN